MYFILLIAHSLFRWLVLVNLLSAIYMSYKGIKNKLPFSKWTNTLRHWTATIAHIQLLLGMAVYIQSPVVASAASLTPGNLNNEHVFFKYFHIFLMVLAIVLVTIGSAKARRTSDQGHKYKLMFKWFTAGFIVILIAIPWPFSPFAGRPLFRGF